MLEAAAKEITSAVGGEVLPVQLDIRDPGGVMDTLGAGDTFNAAVIGCLASGLRLAESVEIGCQVCRQWIKMED